MKKAGLLSMVLLLVFFMLLCCVSCVSKTEYDKVKADLAATQAQVNNLQSQLSALQGQLSAKESELQAATGKLNQVRARMQIMNTIFIPALTGELDNMTQLQQVNLFLKLRDDVKALGDPALEAKLLAMTDSSGSSKAANDFFTYFFQNMTTILK